MDRVPRGPVVGAVVLIAVLAVGTVAFGDGPTTAEFDNRDDAEYRVTVYGASDVDSRPDVAIEAKTGSGDRRVVEYPFRTDLRNVSVLSPAVRRATFLVPPNDDVSVEIGTLDPDNATVFVVETTGEPPRMVGFDVLTCDSGGQEFGGTIVDGTLRKWYSTCA